MSHNCYNPHDQYHMLAFSSHEDDAIEKLSWNFVCRNFFKIHVILCHFVLLLFSEVMSTIICRNDEKINEKHFKGLKVKSPQWFVFSLQPTFSTIVQIFRFAATIADYSLA
jgi:hypothetical protein